jgi:hypothetical protein
MATIDNTAYRNETSHPGFVARPGLDRRFALEVPNTAASALRPVLTAAKTAIKGNTAVDVDLVR